MLQRRGEHDELLAAPAGHAVVGANGPAQARAYLGQNRVPDLMAKGVVDPLEVVDVDEHEAGDQPLAARAVEFGLEHLGEVAAVEQPGQCIGAGGLAQALLGEDLRRRLAHDSLDDQAIADAARHAAAHDPARDAVEPDHAAAHLAHLAAQVAGGVLAVAGAILGVHGLDPGTAPIAVFGHAPEQTLPAGPREERLAPAVGEHLVDVHVVVDRLDDAGEGVRALARLT